MSDISAISGGNQPSQVSSLVQAQQSLSDRSKDEGGFAAQLSQILNGLLNQSSSGSHFRIDVSPGTGSTPRQVVVTIDDATGSVGSPSVAPPPTASPSVSSATSTPTTSAPAADSAAQSAAWVQAITSSAGGSSASGTSPNTAGAHFLAGYDANQVWDAMPVRNKTSTVDLAAHATAADAYWAGQPAEVQELRSIQDPGQRADQASALAKQGFSIDVPIMVWKWDPLSTMQYRKDLGYTWVPSMFQSSVSPFPGSTDPAYGYDAAHPAKNSIAVRTDFGGAVTHPS